MFDISLSGIIAQVEANKIVLPAMQRPFVWKEDRITRLVDSMLRGFPIGTTLLWKTSAMQRFRPFQKDINPDAGITSDFQSTNSGERYLVLDGQQRLTSLFVALTGTYEGKSLFLNVLSGQRGDKDPGDTYWDCRFLTEKEARELSQWPPIAGEKAAGLERSVFVRFQDLTRLQAAKAGIIATKEAKKLGLDSTQTEAMTQSYLQAATILASSRALQVHLIDQDAIDPMPVEEILEIFVRVNSGGLILQKSDLLMSLLDLKWNDIQPDLYRSISNINKHRPFTITRDDLLKSLLLANNSETRFDRLVTDRLRVEKLASNLPQFLPRVCDAWKALTIFLVDDCKITSERFFRGGHNSLLPFLIYLLNNPNPKPAEKRRLVIAMYIALMSGIFAGAEARMGAFARRECKPGKPFPIDALCKMVYQYYGIDSLESLLTRHLDLTLNIAHGGISLDNNPENLQRDHIFPRSKLIEKGVSDEKANHYANFHFLRGKDNLNKSNIPPHKWFASPGDQPGYSDADLAERLLNRDLLQPGKFSTLIKTRSELIKDKALKLFNLSSINEFDKLFEFDREE